MNKYLIGLCAMLLVAMYFLAYDAGKRSVAVKAGEAVAKNWKARGIEDGKAQGMSGVALCVELGGVQSDCDELRGLDKKPTVE